MCIWLPLSGVKEFYHSASAAVCIADGFGRAIASQRPTWASLEVDMLSIQTSFSGRISCVRTRPSVGGSSSLSAYSVAASGDAVRLCPWSQGRYIVVLVLDASEKPVLIRNADKSNHSTKGSPEPMTSAGSSTEWC